MPITAFVMFNMPAEARDPFIKEWEGGTAVVVTADGFIEGSFYEAQSDDRTFQFVNVATWESKEAMMTGRDLGVEAEEAAGDERQQRLKDMGVTMSTVVTRLHTAYGPAAPGETASS